MYNDFRRFPPRTVIRIVYTRDDVHRGWEGGFVDKSHYT